MLRVGGQPRVISKTVEDDEKEMSGVGWWFVEHLARCIARRSSAS
jgi:hypothetical protein